MKMTSWVEINLSALSHNVQVVQKKIGKGTKILAIVKSNAYGHGLLNIAMTCEKAGVDGLGVADLNEAIKLREHRIKIPINILSPTSDKNVREIQKYKLTPTLSDLATAERFSRQAARNGSPITVHVKVDTGMGRFGINLDNAVDTICKVRRMPGLILEGLLSHLASVRDQAAAVNQLNLFENVVQKLRERGVDVPFKHILASGGILRLPSARMDVVRPGLILYGLYPLSIKEKEYLDLYPVMNLKTRILFMKNVKRDARIGYGATHTTRRPSTVAVLPLGFADGYNRALSNKSYVLIQDRKAPVVGNVSMNHTMIDVTSHATARVGDVVTLFGRDQKEQITVNQLIKDTSLIPNEVVCGINERLPKVYRGQVYAG